MSMEWEKRTLGEISNQVGGILQTGPFGSQLHESDYSERGVPVIMPKNLIEGKISTEDIARVSYDNVERLSRHKLKAGDIVYGRRGDIGRQALIRQEQEGWLCGTGCLRISLGESVVDPRFLHYYLRQEDVIGWISNQAIGATMPNLNTTILRSIPVKVPPLPVQRRIADILSTYDDLIENNQRRIKILENMARSLYREWFVDFRFPSHESVPLVDSPFGKIPEGWEVRKIGEVISKTKRKEKIPKTKYLEQGAFPIIDQGKDFVGGYTDNHDALIVDELPLIVFGDHTRILKYIDFPFACGADGTQLIRSDADRMPTTLFFYTLCSVDLKSQYYARHFSVLKDKYIILPDMRSAQQFARLVSPTQAQLSCLRNRNVNLRRTRDLLLPRLLSGQLDVSKVEQEHEELAAS